MIIKPYQGKHPQLHPTVRIAENAAVIGDVTCEAHVSLWYSVTVRGDMDAIFIGADTNVQDNCVLHCDTGTPVRIGRGCVLGHGAIVHSCTVGEGTMVGMGATLLSGCQVGAHCIVGANALVTGKMNIPPYSLVMGCPARVVGQVSPEQADYLRYNTAKYIETAEAQLEAVGDRSPQCKKL
ncbi:MAG: gamma carbonic anhydrase family protein [Clostridiales bacterium]|nr:gamma carbonic anhydrase family protein [Clostridiales bacterium]